MKISFPHPLIILLAFVLLSWLATFLVSSGTYDRQIDEYTGRE
ncbi:hypothetical protein, partial [Algoriphagus sp.]